VTEQKYGWAEEHSELASGPFDSKEAALEDARGCYAEDEHPTLVIGTCRFADPADYVPSVDDLLEQMEVWAHDEDFHFYDDRMFDVQDKEAAQQELNAWAAKHLYADAVWALVELERIGL